MTAYGYRQGGFLQGQLPAKQEHTSGCTIFPTGALSA